MNFNRLDGFDRRAIIAWTVFAVTAVAWMAFHPLPARGFTPTCQGRIAIPALPDADGVLRPQSGSWSVATAAAPIDGGTVVVGSFMAKAASFGGNCGTLSSQLPNGLSVDPYIAKYDANCVCQWARQVAGTGTSNGYAVDVDGADIYFGGQLSGSNTLLGVALDGGIYGNQAWLAKLTPDGQLAKAVGGTPWVRVLGAKSNDYLYGLSARGGTVAAAVQFTNTLLLDPGASPASMTAQGFVTDGAVILFSAAGAYARCALQVSGASDDSAQDVAIDLLGNVYAIGSHGGSAGATATIDGRTLGNAGRTDNWMARISSASCAAFVARRWGGPTDDHVSRLAVMPNNDVVIAGDYSGAATADFGAALPVCGQANCPVELRVTPGGGLAWARVDQNPKPIFGYGDAAYGAAADGEEILSVGGMINVLNFGGGALNTQGSYSPYFLRMAGDGTYRDAQVWPSLSARATGVTPSAIVGKFSRKIDFGLGEMVAQGAAEAFIVGFGAQTPAATSTTAPATPTRTNTAPIPTTPTRTQPPAPTTTPTHMCTVTPASVPCGGGQQ